MFACLISVERGDFAVVVTSYLDVTGSKLLVGSSTSRDYAYELEVPWARNIKVASLGEIEVRESRTLQSSFEIESNSFINLR